MAPRSEGAWPISDRKGHYAVSAKTAVPDTERHPERLPLPPHPRSGDSLGRSPFPACPTRGALAGAAGGPRDWQRAAFPEALPRPLRGLLK
ncbi:hypothetical protein LEMLEM_LOCUS17513 [Lemmus lemmus]